MFLRGEERPVLDRSGEQAPVAEPARKASSGAVPLLAVGDFRDAARELLTGEHQYVADQPVSVEPIEGQTYPIEGEEIDLELPVRDALLLELPVAPLCRDDCAGLCSVCGADRNQVTCSCDMTVPDPRWDALRELTFDN